MTDKVTVGAKQIAMSRALGAAFLSHQVEQLEKTVVANRGGHAWRGGRQRTGVVVQTQQRRGGTPTTPNRSHTPSSSAPRSVPVALSPGRTSPVSTRRRVSEEEQYGKDADVVVVDASVLIHALYQVKRWCQHGRQEVVIVPLEALNTLDLLKKGTSSLAQRARAASRILEAQVGTNPRIRVQRDDAYVYWDKIDFNNTSSTAQPLPSPEWVRRTICCVKWEATNAHITLGTPESTNTPRVLFAVLSSSTTSPQSSPQSNTLGLESTSPTETTPVVPLPAPTAITNKFEPRSAGTLVAHWAEKAGVEIFPVEASVPGHGRVGLDDDDASHPHPTGRPVKGSPGYGYGGGPAHFSHGRRKPSVGAGSGGGGGAYANAHGNNVSIPGATGLVERPPAVKAMMEMVSSQPNGKVVRVLARGEKLDP